MKALWCDVLERREDFEKQQVKTVSEHLYYGRYERVGKLNNYYKGESDADLIKYRNGNLRVKRRIRFKEEFNSESYYKNDTMHLEAYATLKHEAIAGFYGFEMDHHKILTAIMDYYPKGDLMNMLEMEENGTAPKEWNATAKMKVLYGIASALTYIHSKGFIYRQLAPDSIFLTDEYEPKIGDFEITCDKEYHMSFAELFIDSTSHLKDNCAFQAPSALDGNHYNERIDIYSYGTLFLSLVTNKGIKPRRYYRPLMPHLGELYLEHMRRLVNEEGIPEMIREVIQNCWDMSIDLSDIMGLMERGDLCLPDTDMDDFHKYITKIHNSPGQNPEAVVREELHRMFVGKVESMNTEASNYIIDRDEIVTIGKLRNETCICQLTTRPASQMFAQKTITVGDTGGVSFERELEVLAKLSHPCITKLVGAVLPTADFPGEIITEFVRNGSLEEVLTDVRDGEAPSFWTPTAKALVITGIALGMRYLHKMGIFHRDLKPSNIYLDDNHLVRLSGFESSRFVSDLSELTMRTESPLYIAPEVATEDYDSKVDVYAFGLILYEILTGERVFSESLSMSAIMKMASEGIRPKIPEYIHKDIRLIIEQCWSVSKDQRPSFNGICDTLCSIDFCVVSDVSISFVQEYFDAVVTRENAHIVASMQP